MHEPGEGTVGDAIDQIWDIDGNTHLVKMFVAAILGVTSQIELLERVAANGDTQEERDIANAILAEAEDFQELKNGILAALGRIAVAAPVSTAVVRQAAPVDVEVLPAVRTTSNTTGSPQDLLDTLDKLKVFDGSYRDKFNQLTNSNPTKEIKNDNA